MKTLLFLSLILMIPLGSSAKDFLIKSKSDAEHAIKYVLQNKGKGSVLSFSSDQLFVEKKFSVGSVANFSEFTSCFRNKSCWMIPAIGKRIQDIHPETQFLLIKTNKSGFLMLIPLVDEITRCSINGNIMGELEIVAETGDSLTKVSQFKGLYILSGSNPRTMIKQAMGEIQSALQSFSLKNEKKAPWIMDYFGWCTYNALYGNLSKDTLAYAMKNFRNKQIPVRYMIIDGGWQSNKNELLDSFEAMKSKFPEGIGKTISMLKNDYNLDKVLIWNTLWGTFRGLDPVSFGDKAVKVGVLPPARMSYLLKKKQGSHIEQEATVGPGFYPGFLGQNIYIPSDFDAYYNDYYKFLNQNGADGTKVDAMTWIETTGNNRGGRVHVLKEMMHGMQSAVNEYFNNELINCSSLSNDYLFNTTSSNLTRTSGDFFPDKPESHGFHIFTNAHVSFWTGDVISPDWDMFQSGHPSGAFHAAARAISGGPVYTTEVIGTENKAVLDRLMTTYGRLPRCKDAGRICTGSLFSDPADKLSAIKIYNKNQFGGIVGAFNCSYDPEKDCSVEEKVKASDVEELEGSRFAVYRFSNGELSIKSKDDFIPVQLKKLEFELVTIIPVQNGFAPVGVTDKYNPGGMITGFSKLNENSFSIDLMDGGKFLAWSDKKPVQVLIDSKPVQMEFTSGKLMIDVPKGKEINLIIKF